MKGKISVVNEDTNQPLAVLAIGASRFTLMPSLINGINVQIVSRRHKSTGKQSFPLANIASTLVVRSSNVALGITTAFLAVMALTLVGSSVKGGVVTGWAMFAFWCVISALIWRRWRTAYFEVVNNAGQRMQARVTGRGVEEAEAFVRQVNEAISALHHQG